MTTRISTAERRRLFGEPGDRTGVTSVPTPWGIDVVCHRLIVNVFASACAAAVRASAWKPRRIDSYNPRVVRGSTSPSLHGFGLAWDFFATPPGVVPPGGVWNPDNGVSADFARAFEDQGFTWGARFTTRRDVPHIEWAGAPPRPFQQRPPELPTTLKGGRMILVQVEGEAGVSLFFGRGDFVPIEDPADRDAIIRAGVPFVQVKRATFEAWARVA